jgi:dihydroxy-acid dehydratase
MYRNFLAMEVEELLRCQPVDGVVLMGGCDKTTPALLMGAITMNLPAIYLPAGPMLRGNWNGQILGSGSDVWKFWAERCAGNITDAEWNEMEDGIARSPGHCMTMGTASTMTSIAEALGMTLPGATSIPAVDANHQRMATACGRRIVEMVWEDLKPSDILTMQSFENAITTDMAIGGSTNAIIHLVAMAGRAGIKLDLKKFDEIAHRTPMIANIRPSGQQYLMEDFYYAGGLRALLNQIGPLLYLDCLTVNGQTLGENIAGAKVCNADVIRTIDNPVAPQGGTAILYGNLAPNGAVIKPTAAEKRLHQHTGRAVVFKDYNDMAARIDDENLEVGENSVIVLQNAGPLGGPGMPEWGMLPIPKKLLKKGVRDMVRISDARMSGTSYGACVLHVAPESYIGGPLAFVRGGDLIELDVADRKLNLRISEEEMARRRAEWTPPPPRYERGFGALFSKHVTQADQGCDFDFLHAGAETPEPEIH